MSINTNNDGYPIAELKTLGRYSKSEFISFDKDTKADDVDEIDAYIVSKDNKGSLEVIPPSIGDKSVERDVYFVSGQGGSGKSYFSTQLFDKYRRAGINHIFVITDQEDRKFGKVKYINIHDFVQPAINEDFEIDKRNYEREKIKFKHLKQFLEPEERLKYELKLADLKPVKQPQNKGFKLVYDVENLHKIFKDSVILFDDYEKNADLKQIEVLRDHLLTQSRHYNCSMIICNHELNGGHSFKLIKKESTNYVLFNTSLEYDREALFKRYIGFTKKQRGVINRMLKESRWICYNIKNHLTISQKMIVNMDTI